MKTFKKVISLICVLALMLSLFVGCQKETTSVKSAENETENNDNASKKYTYTVNLLHVDGAENELLDFLKQKFNIDFEMLPVTWGDWNEKVRLWISSGDMPDIMWWDLKSYNYPEFKSFAEQGMFKEISAVENYPNLKKLTDSLKSDDYFMVDGKRYVWTASRGTSDINNLGDMGFYYRKDWAEKLGMAKDEYTWAEMQELIKAFIEKDPGGNGAGNTHGMGCVGWGFPTAFLQNVFPNVMTYYEKGGEYVWGASQPEALEAVKMIKKLYDENIIWQDQVFAKTMDAENKFIAGQLGVYYDNLIINHVRKVRNEMVKANPDADPEKAFAPMIIKTPQNKYFGVQTEDYWSATVFNPEMSDDKFDRILTAWDWIASDEGFNYVTNGIKGADWEIKDGKIVNLTDKVYTEEQIDLFRMVKLTDEYGLIDPRVDKKIREDVKSYRDIRTNNDTSMVWINYDLDFFSAPNKDKYGVFDNEIKEKVIEILVMPDADVEAEWNNFVKSMMPKVEKVLKELNEGLIK